MLPIDIPQPTRDFLLTVNSNHGRITTVCETYSCTEVENRYFHPLVFRYSPYRPVAEERPAISM